MVLKEGLGLVRAINHFRLFLLGRHFDVYTDHQPLVYLHNVTNPSSILIRWAVMLQQFNFTAYHIKGRLNVVTDALSRLKQKGDPLVERNVDFNSAFAQLCDGTADCNTIVKKAHIRVTNLGQVVLSTL